MRSSFLIILFILVLKPFSAFGENVLIQAKNITLNKNSEISIFENEVLIKTKDGDSIKSEFAEYDRKNGIIKLKNNIIANDIQNNQIKAEKAEYNEKNKIFTTIGETKITTTEKYVINGKDIILSNFDNFIKSDNKTVITDQDDNRIFLDNFDYSKIKNIFKSTGNIKIIDNKNNTYEFSQIYIDTKSKEILGTDSKAFLNDESFKINEKNKPRIFSNTVSINENKKSFDKSIFTICDYRENDKCPPWTIQASKMLHDNKKKTIYYDNAVIKVYDIPILYIPKLSHPDPTVKRRSGFLTPSFSDTKNLGSNISVPYFWAINHDKNFTLTNNFYASENPLFLGEYHQDFKILNLLADFGYTEGYKNISATKKRGDKSHFFTKIVKKFDNNNSDSENSFDLSVQHVSNDKYLKLYKIKSNLVDYNTNNLENSLNFTHEDDNLFLGFNTSVYETLNENYNDKYEYILPEVTLEKNLISNQRFGSLDLQSNYKFHNYDTNKSSNFFVNNLNWQFKEFNFSSGVIGKFLGTIKNINYETKNIDLYKQDTTNELFGAIGYLTEINLKKTQIDSEHLLKPKIFLRYAPGSMRQETSSSRLNPLIAFNIDRLDNNNNFETGLTSSLGLDYKYKKNGKDFDFSVAQIVNDKENKKMASESSLDEKLSDMVGSANYKINDNFNLNYNFALDQNYNEFNYNEIGTAINLNSVNLNLSYLKENQHIGNQEYFKTKLQFENKDRGVFSLETKRNLVTNSAEFYNLSYEYLNDCLRAGIVYRREFYNDSEIEPENSLMFKVTITPFGNINSPSFNQ